VANPGFENISQCPDDYMQINRAYSWWGISTDLLNTCNPGIVPLNIGGYQYPHSGNSFAGFMRIYFHSINKNREFLFNKLSQPLVKKKYCVDYYYSIGEYSPVHGTTFIPDSLGIMFSVDSLADILTYNPNFQPQIITQLVNDTINWIHASALYNAAGGEKYMTIGSNNTTYISDNTILYYGEYMFVDDFSVCECSFEFSLGNDTLLCPGDNITLHAGLPNAVFTWQDGSQGDTYNVTQPGVYWVKAYVSQYNYTSYDTIVVYDGDADHCALPLEVPNVITPNNDGANDRLVITNSNYWDINLMIYNRWGNLIYQNADYRNDFDCNGCGESVYFYVLQATAKRSGRKIERTGTITVLR